MSQHNIVGSEAFQRAPFVYIRNLPAGGFRRRRSRLLVGFVAGATAMIGLGAAGAALAYAVNSGLI